MDLKRRWIRYINKENYDYTQGIVDPYDYHSSFHAFSRLFRVLDNEPMPGWLIVTPVYVVTCGIVAGLMFLVSVIHYVQTFQVHFITECGTYLIVMVYKLLIISCTILDTKYYHSFLRSMREDFKYIATRGLKYRDRYFKNQLVTFKACVFVALFTGSIGSGMMICGILSLVYFMTVHDINYGNGRPLPFPFWLFNWDLHATPTYEIVFLLSNMFVISHTYTYIFMMQTQILWISQITSKADIIIWSIEDLLLDIKPANNIKERKHYDLVIKHRMREIVTMHHSMIKLMEDFAGVYRKCLLFEQKFAVPIICSTAFCTAEKFDAGEIHTMLILLCVSVIILVFIPSYLCTFLAEKVQSISDACWNMPFWNAGPIVRSYAVLMMQRSMRPLPIQAAGFEDISLQTYSNVMTRSYSLFNMLRQGNFDIS